MKRYTAIWGYCLIGIEAFAEDYGLDIAQKDIYPERAEGRYP